MVHGQKIYGVVAHIQCLFIPFRKMFHERSGGAANADLNRSVNPFHGLGGLIYHNAVTEGILVPGAELPGAVHFVSEIPGLYAVGLLVAVFTAQVGPVGAALVVRVFDQVHCVLRAAGSHVNRVKGLGADLFGPLQIFVMSYLVGNVLIPGGIQVNFSFGLRADGILPLPCRNEVSAGKTDCRKTGLFECVNEVGAETLLVRSRVLRVVHRAVDHRSDGLKKSREQTV